MIRQVQPADAGGIADIYNHYILNTATTFEEEAVSANDMSQRFSKVASFRLPWLIAEENTQTVGYTYATKWNDRFGYRFSVEVTVYLSQTATAKGWGTKLYDALFAHLKSDSVHAVIGVIALPNPASVALHEKFGMEKVGHLKEVGYKFNQRIDVGYWQCIL